MKHRTIFASWNLFLALLGLSSVVLLANPTGGNVAAGSASIAGQGTGDVTIHQASNTAIINWQTFSIGSGELTTFLQPNAQSAALNRVLGGQTSVIDGTLSANGQIYLINGNGIVVGPGGVINAGAFTASTRDIADSDFLKGKLHFTGSNNAGVQNLGKIEALGGDVVLIGKTVDNQGTINAAKGTVGLIAGDDVLLAQKNADGSTILVSPTTTAMSASGLVGVHNSGTITAAAAELKAANGNIYALAIQNEGLIRATTVKNQGGHIWLVSDMGTVSNSGTLNASATAVKGNGGMVVVKSNTGTVSYTGAIVAQGGQSGAGGNAEVSGNTVQITGTVNLTAFDGTTGSLHIDPATLDIITGGGSNPTNSTLDPGTVVSLLNGANLTLQADTSITVTDVVNASGNSMSGNLILDAPADDLNAAITLKNGSTFSGAATMVNVGANGLVQNGIDAAAAGAAVNLAGATYALNSEIVIGKNLTLNGQSAISTILNGQNTTRVMEIDGSASGITVNLNGLTLENGNGSGGRDNGEGGGLLISAQHSMASMAISNSTISNNSSASSVGGGIFNDGSNGGVANLVIANSTISDNSAVEGSGVYNNGSAGHVTLTINSSTVSGNSGSPGNPNIYGAGIYNDGTFSGNAALIINDSTLSNNSSDTSGGLFTAGGGIINVGYQGVATTTVNNSTIADNRATNGAALYNNGEQGNATLSVFNSTITGNTTGTGSGTGGAGIYNDSLGGNVKVTVGNTILAGNANASGEDDYTANSGAMLISNGHNLYGQNGNTGGFTGNGTTDILLGGNISTVLVSLGNYGGPTQTMALVVGSSAYLTGGLVGSVTTDQRGVTRGGTISIGAYDFVPTSLMVNTKADNTEDIIGGTTVSLRDAFYYANLGAIFNPDITFDSNIFATPQTISLAQGELVIGQSLTLEGPSVGVTLDAHQTSRVMEIDGSASGVTVNLSGLTLENGNGTGMHLTENGGGLLVYAESGNKATVTISNSTISNNLVSGSGSGGGGIENDGSGGSATLTINDSTISGNVASNAGGGIDSDGPTTYGGAVGGSVTVTITGSTISGNSAYIGGGIISEGVYSSGAALTISNSTLSDNSAAYVGGIYNYTAVLTISNSTISGNSSNNGTVGGIFNYASNGSATLTIDDTILAGNTASGVESDYSSVSGILTDKGYNLFGANTNLVLTGTDIQLANGISINTVLAPLGNYGGPTQTMALVVGSPAYLKGGSEAGVMTDERGVARGSAISIGAYDYVPTSLIVNMLTDKTEDVIGVTTVSLRDALYPGFPI